METKSTYIVSKSMVTGIIILILSVVLIIAGYSKNKTVNKAVDYEDLTAQNLTDGQYVTFIVDTYLIKKKPFSASYSGLVNTHAEAAREYNTYTAFLSDGRLIRINIYDATNRYVLKQYEYDDLDTDEPFKYAHGERIVFTGMVKAVSDTQSDWYADIDGFDTDSVVPNFEITEVEEKAAVNIQYLGFVGLLIAVIFLTRSSKVEKRTSVGTDYKDVYTTHRPSEAPATPYFTPVNVSWEKAKEKREQEELDAAGEEKADTSKEDGESKEPAVPERPTIGDAESEELPKAVKPESTAERPMIDGGDDSSAEE